MGQGLPRVATATLWLMLAAPLASQGGESRTHTVQPQALDRGQLPGLTLHEIGDFDVASFSGRGTLRGTFKAEWTYGVDPDLTRPPTEAQYWFLLDKDTEAKLPHWKGYIAHGIGLTNGPKALELFAGRKVADRFLHHRIDSVAVPGTLTFSHLKVWVECDSPNAQASADSVSDLGPVQVIASGGAGGC